MSLKTGFRLVHLNKTELTLGILDDNSRTQKTKIGKMYIVSEIQVKKEASGLTSYESEMYPLSTVAIVTDAIDT